MQLWAVLFLLTSASKLYMFRTLSAPIIRSTKNCSNSHLCVSWVGMMYIQQRRPRSVVYYASVVDNRTWTSLLDIHHSVVDNWTRTSLLDIHHSAVDNRTWTSLLDIHHSVVDNRTWTSLLNIHHSVVDNRTRTSLLDIHHTVVDNGTKTSLLTYSMEQSPSWEANWFCS